MGTSKNFSIKLNFFDSIWLVWRQAFQLNAKSNSKLLVLPPQNDTPIVHTYSSKWEGFNGENHCDSTEKYFRMKKRLNSKDNYQAV